MNAPDAFIRRAIAPVCFALLLCCTLHAADAPAKIPADKLKPGAEFFLDLPDLGHSSRLAQDGQPNKPVQLYVILPDNYKPDKPFPVIVHCGGGAGNIKEIGGWKRCLGGKNFILISVDYNVDLEPARDRKFTNAIACLEMLKRSTTVDESSVFLTGFSSGAYGIADWATIPEAKVFCGFVIMCGGSGMLNAKLLNGRPVLFVAGETDTAKASGGMSRVDAQKKMHDNLLQAGGDSEILVQPGAGHEWKADSDPVIADWIYRKLPSPEFHRMRLFAKLKALTALEWRKAWYQERLAAYWLDIPGLAK